MIIGAIGGMNEATTANVPSGSDATANDEKKPTISISESGVSTDCRSSWRETSEAAQANAAP